MKEKNEELKASANQGGTLDVGLRDIIGFVRKYAILILIVGLGSAIFGVAISFLAKRTYKAEVVLLPEMGNDDRKGLSALASGLASLGLSTGDTRDAVRPDLYPSIILSTPCILEVLQEPVTDKEGVKYPSLEAFLKRDSTKKKSSFFSFLSLKGLKKADTLDVKNISVDGVLSVDMDKYSLIKTASSIFDPSLDLRSGVINISAETEDPVVASMVLMSAVRYLERFVKEYRGGKIIQQIGYLENTVAKARKEMNDAQYRLQSYRDRNRNVFMNVSKIEEQKLIEEYQLAQSLYNDLVRQYEESKIKLKDERPVFKVLDPAHIPLFKSGPKRINYAVAYMMIGLTLVLAYIVFIKDRLFQKFISRL